jgi:hypothetical protein
VKPLLLMLAAVAVLTGCGGGDGSQSPPPPPPTAPVPPHAPGLGTGPRYRPPSLGARAARGLPVLGMTCSKANRSRHGVHLELFASRRVVLVAPGIGVAPPRERRGAYVRSGRCSYPVRTREPTGVVEVESGRPARTLGDLFAVWGQPLSRHRMAGFRGRVRVYVGGRHRGGDPRAIPLRRHAQIVLGVDGYVPPHRSYHFPPSL